MERSLIAVENVRNLQADGKRWLEDILGCPLQEDQQVFIMVLSPGTEPDETARRQARSGLEAVFQKTEARAREQGIDDDDIDAAIREAMQHIRPKND
jgi:hypothetical protein